MTGVVYLVDHETIELTNLQRYALAERADVDALKVDVASRYFTGSMAAETYPLDWRRFASKSGYNWPAVLLALDSATDRREVQASLPRWIANAWTQPGDLGVSVHPDFNDGGACVSCLYLQDQRVRNEDELVAAALAVPEHVAQVRQLLYTGEGVQPALLDLIAARLQQPVEVVRAFAGRPIRELYVDGICGGAVLPLGHAEAPDPNVHVPLAHQSALAGVLLSAAYLRSRSERPASATAACRIDLLRRLGEIEPQPLLKRGDGRCICEDDDYRQVYAHKWCRKPRERQPAAAKQGSRELGEPAI
jgi:hypothetical protein